MTDINSFIDFTDFPNNIVMQVSTLLPPLIGLDPANVYRRALRPTDPSMSVGILAVDWNPIEYEIGQSGPAQDRYNLIIQCMVVHADEVLGLAAHAMLSKRIRRVLDTDPDVRVALSQLSTTNDGVTERTLKFQTRRQQFLSNELDNKGFAYVAALEWYLETETVTA